MGRSRNRGRLNVWLNGVPAGQWNNAGSTPTFKYFDEWLAHEQGRPLSLSMPFRPDNGSYSGDLVTNYFDNLLPDSEPIRRRLAQRHQTGGTTPFELLSKTCTIVRSVLFLSRTVLLTEFVPDRRDFPDSNWHCARCSAGRCRPTRHG
jgi:HipA-like protein